MLYRLEILSSANTSARSSLFVIGIGKRTSDTLTVEPGRRFEHLYLQLFDRSELLHRTTRYSGFDISEQF